MTTLLENGNVEFRFFRPEAGFVKIVGNFTARNPTADLAPNTTSPDTTSPNTTSSSTSSLVASSLDTTFDMGGSSDGWWSTKIDIPPGEYRFRYEVDGRWFTDFAASGVEPSPLGFLSLLVVPVRSFRK